MTTSTLWQLLFRQVVNLSNSKLSIHPFMLPNETFLCVLRGFLKKILAFGIVLVL